MQAHSDWIHIQNPFTNILDRSYQKTEIFTLDHIAKLTARRNDEIRLETLIAETQYKYNSFSGSYTAWRQTNKNYNAATARVEEKLALLANEGGLIEEWDLRIQLVFRKNTVEYQKELFPQGRKPFKRGAKDLRIRAVSDLAQVLTQFSDLDEVQKQVHDYHLEISQLRHEQQQLEQQVKHSASLLRKAKSNLIQQLGYNKDMLLVIFRYERLQVLDFFAIDMVRKRQKTKGNSVETEGASEEASTTSPDTVDELIAVPEVQVDRDNVVIDEEPAL